MFGAPGSGKGTQAKQMAEKFQLEHVSTGDLFRYEISHKTPLGLKAQEIINRGDLCPDDITLGMLRNHIEKHADSKGFIFDGVPRTIKQAEMLDDPTFFNNLDITKVIYLKVEMEEVQRRILKRAEIEQRADDTPPLSRPEWRTSSPRPCRWWTTIGIRASWWKSTECRISSTSLRISARWWRQCNS